MTPPYRVSQRTDLGFFVRTLPEDLIPPRNGVVAWWSGVKRNGEWVLPRAFRAFTCMGNIELDLTQARMGAGVSEMELNCFMGAIDVIVPPDIRVICDGEGMFGTFEMKRTGNATPPPDAPTLQISGTAYFSAVNIKIVDPNAPTLAQKLKAGWQAFTG